MSSYKLQKVKEYLKENLKKKFITLSKASFASSILFVKKKDDSLCFCMNYRKLNAVEIVSRSFNQRDSRLICMYCSLKIAITRH